MNILTTAEDQDNLPRYFAQAFQTAQKMQHGRLDVKLKDGRVFRTEGAAPGPVAEFTVHNNDLFARIIREGDLGFCDAYLDGWWSTPDLQAFMDLVHADNDDVYDGYAGMALVRAYEKLRFWMQSNSKAFPFIHEAYPEALKKFQHSSGVKRSQIWPMASMS